MKRAAYALAALVACTVQLGDGERRTTARELTADVILPTFDEVVARASDQATAIRAFVAAPSSEQLELVRSAWRAARVPWKETDAFRFGPAKDLGYTVAIDQPVEPDKIEIELAGTGVFDAAYVENLGANKKGFHAIEYLAFADSILADARRRELLVAYAENLEIKARALRAVWTESYAAQFAQPGSANPEYATIKSVIDALANESLFQTELLADSRIGKPFGLATGGVPQPDLEESGPSDNSLADLVASLHGIRNIYFGSRDGTPGKGLGKLVAQQSTATDREVRLALDAAEAAIAQIPRPYRQALIEQRPEIAAAHAAVKELKQIIATEVIGALGSTLKFNDNDGD